MEIGKINFGPELGSKEHPMIPAKDFKWPAQDASEDASLLDTSSPSPTPAPEDWKIPLDRLDLIGQRTAAMELHLIEIRGMLQTIIQALAEDQDPDELPATYLDGSRV